MGIEVLKYCLVDDPDHGGDRLAFRRMLDEPAREAVVVVAESDAAAMRALAGHGHTFEFCDSLRVRVWRAEGELEALDAAVAKCISDGIDVETLRMWIAHAETMRRTLGCPQNIGPKRLGSMTEACKAAREKLIHDFGGEA